MRKYTVENSLSPHFLCLNSLQEEPSAASCLSASVPQGTLSEVTRPGAGEGGLAHTVLHRLPAGAEKAGSP